jgi:diguanylate cyclase (GGDEF)-like protein
MAGDQSSRWIVRASVAGLLVVLCFLAGFSVMTQTRAAGQSRRADAAGTMSNLYQDARFWVGQEESLERKYRLEPGAAVLALHNAAEQSLTADLQRLGRIDSSPANHAVVRHLLALDAEYVRASHGMFRAVDAHRPALVIHFDHAIVDPVFGVMQAIVYHNATVASQRSLGAIDALRRNDTAATQAIVIAFGAGIALLLTLGVVIAYVRRRLSAAHLAEYKRMAEVAITDPLTGLRNHRAFHEDLARSLHRTGRTGVPISLVMLDLDQLKKVNDSLGHQAGDDHLKTLTKAILSTVRGTDGAYRIGGDEFAVSLDGTRAWSALEFTHRLNAALSAETHSGHVTASAGIAERLGFSDKDELIREADLALIAAKRCGQHALIYTPEIEPHVTTDPNDEHHTRTLASALALAVDAKDAYTRSHSQTVSQLSGLIAAELGFDSAHVAQMRLAGLLHDVGKIGIPDAILNKPAKLTPDEYETMKTHSVLGHDIVLAADMPVEAGWIRHHHERYDGHGYPDGISGESIPLESRIILVADSFEAMTSDRPYRKAPGQQFAIDELHRHSASQFDPHVVDALCRRLEAHLPDPSTAREAPPATLLEREERTDRLPAASAREEAHV